MSSRLENAWSASVSPRGRGGWSPIGVWATVSVALILPHLVKWIYYPAYPGFDDAFIHLRVAENVALGRAWGVNAFDPLNVSSSPIFTLLLAAGIRIVGSGPGWGMLVSAVATSAALALAFAATKATVTRPVFAVVPALLLSVNLHVWRWNATVMEPTLACLAVVTAAAVFEWARRGTPLRFALFGVVTGAAFLTRFELGLLLPAAVAAAACLERWTPSGFDRLFRRAAAVVLGFAPVAVLWAAFCWLTFGTVIPTTFLSKASSWSLTHVTTARSVALVLGSSFAVPALLALVTLWRPVRRRDWSALWRLIEPDLVAVIFAAFCLAFYTVSVAEFQAAARYLLPVIFGLGLALGGVLARALDTAVGTRPSRLALLTAAGTHLALMLGLHHVAVAPVLASFADGYWRASSAAAAYLVSNTAPGDTVLAVSDIGILAYESRDRYRVVDLPGLAAPNLRGLDVGTAARRSAAQYVVEHYGPANGPQSLDGEQFALVLAVPFVAAGVVSSAERFSLNVYRVVPPAAVEATPRRQSPFRY